MKYGGITFIAIVLTSGCMSAHPPRSVNPQLSFWDRLLRADGESYYTSKPIIRKELENLSTIEQRKSAISVQQDQGNSMTATSFAQSFIPKSNSINGVSLKLITVGQSGWLRVDICDTIASLPGNILRRTWVRIPDHTGGNFWRYTLIPFKQLPVVPDDTYWVTFREYADRLDPSFHMSPSLINYVISNKVDRYPDGVMLARLSWPLTSPYDAVFRIHSERPKVLVLRQSNRSEIKMIPDTASQKLPWHH